MLKSELSETDIVQFDFFYLVICSSTHQHTRSHNSSEVKDFLRDVATLLDDLTTWEKQHNVADDTDDGQREEGYTQAFGEISRTHNSVFSRVKYSPE